MGNSVLSFYPYCYLYFCYYFFSSDQTWFRNTLEEVIQTHFCGGPPKRYRPSPPPIQVPDPVQDPVPDPVPDPEKGEVCVPKLNY